MKTNYKIAALVFCHKQVMKKDKLSFLCLACG